jgi:hypothetical protein
MSRRKYGDELRGRMQRVPRDCPGASRDPACETDSRTVSALRRALAISALTDSLGARFRALGQEAGSHCRGTGHEKNRVEKKTRFCVWRRSFPHGVADKLRRRDYPMLECRPIFLGKGWLRDWMI